ncbi:hypothetical protein V8E54_004814 [Elaphomyces granulatus]
MPKRKQGNRGRPPLSTEFFLDPEANVRDQQCAVAQGPPRSSISDDEAEVTHLLDTAELETEPEDVLQACSGTGPPLWPFQPTPAKQAVSILRQVGKGLVCFDDMTLDELRGLIAFLRGSRSRRADRRESGREDPPTIIVVERRELRRFAKLEKPLLRAAVKLAFKKDPHEK